MSRAGESPAQWAVKEAPTDEDALVQSLETVRVPEAARNEGVCVTTKYYTKAAEKDKVPEEQTAMKSAIQWKMNQTMVFAVINLCKLPLE